MTYHIMDVQHIKRPTPPIFAGLLPAGSPEDWTRVLMRDDQGYPVTTDLPGTWTLQQLTEPSTLLDPDDCREPERCARLASLVENIRRFIGIRLQAKEPAGYKAALEHLIAAFPELEPPDGTPEMEAATVSGPGWSSTHYQPETTEERTPAKWSERQTRAIRLIRNWTQDTESQDECCQHARKTVRDMLRTQGLL